MTTLRSGLLCPACCWSSPMTEVLTWMHSNPGKGAMSILLILAILLALALVQNAIDKRRK